MSTIKVDTYLTRGGASEIAIDKLKGASSAGSMLVVGEGGTNTTNLQQGLAKAWIQATSDSSISTQDSFNFSSVTDTSAGRLTPNFSTNMSNNDFSAPMVSNQLHMASSTISTSNFHMTAYNSSHSETDTPQMCCTVHGDLA